ncbi:MAG TPA: class IV lanthionine synthetase LanL [Chloroflexia bacterium]|nr:class IV lanthionine synthetase LanL [Chloroflexia bacterium]
MSQLKHTEVLLPALQELKASHLDREDWMAQLWENPAGETEARHLFMEIVSEAFNTEEARAAGWKVDAGKAEWIRLTHPGATPPSQGWKLHLSATVTSAPRVLRQALPVLLAYQVNFKVAASLERLAMLNQGIGAISQVGKFITVYPANDHQAVELALALDRATAGQAGPAIPSDRVLRPGSLVYYRYGGFKEQVIQTRNGEVVTAIVNPAGELVPDRRISGYYVPEWVNDPFQAAGVSAEIPTLLNPRINQSYFLVQKLHHSARGTVHLAVDFKAARRCVIKQAFRDGAAGTDGRDAWDRLRHEAEVLVHLSPDGRFPAVYELVEQGQDYLALAMEDVEGLTLEKKVNAILAEEDLLSGEKVVAWGRELAAMLGSIHARGLVYRDLKTTNVIVAPDGRLRLIDFELAHFLDSGERPLGLGTRGYMSRQQATRQRPAISDDIYSLGAVLYFLATATEPSQAPEPFALMKRPVRLLNPAISIELEAVIARCLEDDPARRYPSMEAVEQDLAQLKRASVPPPAFGEEAQDASEERARQHYRELAGRLADTLARTAEVAPGGRGRAWSGSQGGMGLANRDLHAGTAGTVLALAELVAHLDHDRDLSGQREILKEAVAWLQIAPRPGGEPLAGLYVGESGIAAALLRAGQVLGEAELVAAAASRSYWISSLPYLSPDLYNGSAGRLRFHLMLWDETGEAFQLEAARQAGDAIVKAARPAGEGELCWTIPEGYGGMSHCTYLGYAHGAAGIGDALLDLYQATGEEVYKEAALGAARWLVRLAMPVLRDKSGLDWQSVEGVKGRGAGMWCHGATGIGRFMLHLAQSQVMPEALALARGAARTVARGTRWAGPVQCHGLSGNLEFLLDMYQATRERAYLVEARSLGQILRAYLVERNGLLVSSSETPDVFSQDYMVGYAGVAVALLRLAEPEYLPHQLSRAGFRCQPLARQ